MSFTRYLSSSRKSRAATGVGVAGLTLVAATFGGAGTAQASSTWELFVSGLPSGTKSVSVQDQETNHITCKTVPSGAGDVRVGDAFAGPGFWVQAYKDSACKQQLTGPRKYQFTADQDRQEIGGDADHVTVWANQTRHMFGNL